MTNADIQKMIDDGTAFVMYFDDKNKPTTVEKATMVRVHLPDGTVLVAVPQ